MEGLLHDARIAIRSFARRPSFVIVAATTLGLGIGAVTTIYSVIHGVLLAPLPYVQPDRIVRVGKISEGRPGILSMSALDLRDVQQRNRSFAALAASRPTSLTTLGDGEPEILRGAMVSAEFFDVLQIYPTVGTAWPNEFDEPGGAPVAILSEALWQRKYVGDPDLIGRSITLNAMPFTVVGVMPADFTPPEALSQRNTDVWIPLAFIDAEARSQRSNGFLQIIGRVREGVSLRSADAELASLGAVISRDFPEPGERVFGLSPLKDETIGRAGPTMLPLFGAVGLLLAIACVNIANLLMIRASERRQELALRRAIGAGRGRVIRQLLTESLVLGLFGGIVGVFLTIAGVGAFVAAGPNDIPRLAEVAVDRPVLLFALGITLLTSLVFGVLPALRGSKTELTSAVRAGGHGGTTLANEERLRNVLVVTETALSFVLVVAAGLLINSFVRLGRADLDFDAENVHVITVAHPGGATVEEVTSFFVDVMDGIRSLPSVTAVGATVNLPLSGNYQQRRVQLLGMSTPGGEDG